MFQYPHIVYYLRYFIELFLLLLILLFNVCQLHGYPNRSKTSEETTNTDTSSNCHFADEISKLRNDLVGNFHDLLYEILNVKNIIAKKRQDKSTQLKATNVNLQHKVIILGIAMKSVEQYNRRNTIEITGLPDNIGGLKC